MFFRWNAGFGASLQTHLHEQKKWLWLVLPIHFFSAAPGCNAGVDIKGQPNKQDASSRNAAGFSILSASVFSVDNDSNPIIRVFWSFA